MQLLQSSVGVITEKNVSNTYSRIQVSILYYRLAFVICSLLWGLQLPLMSSGHLQMYKWTYGDSELNWASGLSGVIVYETKRYQAKIKEEQASEAE